MGPGLLYHLSLGWGLVWIPKKDTINLDSRWRRYISVHNMKHLYEPGTWSSDERRVDPIITFWGKTYILPIRSMGLQYLSIIYHKFIVNVWKYTIHGASVFYFANQGFPDILWSVEQGWFVFFLQYWCFAFACQLAWWHLGHALK